jgi:hypothetical protein
MKFFLLVAGLAMVFALNGTAAAGPPDATFVKFDGQMYGEANQGRPAFHKQMSLTVAVPRGKIIDASYRMGNTACCGGDENRNGDQTSVPTGVYVEITGARSGEYGVFNLVRDSATDDATGELTGYKITADLYCGPSATKGGCNVKVLAWAKLKDKSKN